MCVKAKCSCFKLLVIYRTGLAIKVSILNNQVWRTPNISLYKVGMLPTYANSRDQTS
jgi:hypothetical protein